MILSISIISCLLGSTVSASELVGMPNLGYASLQTKVFESDSVGHLPAHYRNKRYGRRRGLNPLSIENMVGIDNNAAPLAVMLMNVKKENATKEATSSDHSSKEHSRTHGGSRIRKAVKSQTHDDIRTMIKALWRRRLAKMSKVAGLDIDYASQFAVATGEDSTYSPSVKGSHSAHPTTHHAAPHATHHAAPHATHRASHRAPHHATHRVTHRAPHHASHRAPHHASHRAPHHASHRAPHHATHRATHRAPHHATHRVPHHATHRVSHHAPHHATHRVSHRASRSVAHRAPQSHTNSASIPSAHPTAKGEVDSTIHTSAQATETPSTKVDTVHHTQHLAPSTRSRKHRINRQVAAPVNMVEQTQELEESTASKNEL
ncbi:hypothetical protein BSLG_009274 [Batrachochytrium salamandrivorans]|nr:hypothetical protein BASA83_001524 [Batrachochytrium salamandrivorans]KAJ1330512.1 hypothetical protein BSLG_009274 [Batrachochytrium salamandrivorans]